ncbi:JmjC domain [Trinorchestia longiramus]|nr:JmjC domain [Trinorchestia longiramus]
MIELGSSSCNFDSTNLLEDALLPIVNNEMTYDEFFRKFMEPNRPCIFSSDLTDEWTARKHWVNDAKINVKHLSDKYGSSEVPVANCEEKHYDAQRKETFLLQDYIHDYWMKRQGADAKEKCLYLKDWHFVRAHPETRVYETPLYFCSDWLNEFWETRHDCQDDYRFVYLGPKGSWTPFHSDVFRSFSWSANVCGRKQWIFFPPGAEAELRDKTGSLPYDVTNSVAVEDVSAVTVVQEAGQTIFVPSGWHHQVHNLEDTLSINHNWINATNIMAVWEQLVAELAKSVSRGAGEPGELGAVKHSKL